MHRFCGPLTQLVKSQKLSEYSASSPSIRNTSLSYADRLEALNLRPLSERRSIDDISLLHSFIHHHSPVPDSFKNSVTQITHRTREFVAFENPGTTQVRCGQVLLAILRCANME